MLRKNTPEVAAVCDRWHDEVLKHTPRDQMSINYVCWKLGFPLTYWRQPLHRSRYFGIAKANRW